METPNIKDFTPDLANYLQRHGLLETAMEYRRINPVGIDTMGYTRGHQSLFYAFSWSDTVEGFGFWNNHFQRFLIEQRDNKK